MTDLKRFANNPLVRGDITLSIGITSGLGMYDAKCAGKNTFVIYEAQNVA
jgi:hypothetical protein